MIVYNTQITFASKLCLFLYQCRISFLPNGRIRTVRALCGARPRCHLANAVHIVTAASPPHPPVEAPLRGSERVSPFSAPLRGSTDVKCPSWLSPVHAKVNQPLSPRLTPAGLACCSSRNVRVAANRPMRCPFGRRGKHAVRPFPVGVGDATTHGGQSE